MIKIVQKENTILREIAKSVQISSIKNADIQKIIKDMKDALSKEEDGVAIAAPQIGLGFRIFVVSGRVYQIIKNTKKNEQIKNYPDEVYINPKITKLSRRKTKVEEGCLSVRWLYGKVSRSEKATVEAYNEKGEFFTRGGSGLLAQIFQHEIDHLDGILFIDKAENLEEIPPKK